MLQPSRSRRAALVLGTALLTFVGLLLPAPSASASRPHTAPPTASGWYVALGDSLAAGYQPGQGDDRTGGYVGHVLDDVRATTPKTRLENLACSGETSTTLVDGGRCSYVRGSQLGQALHFLHAHSGTTRLVTLTIGANDVTPCLSGPVAGIAGCVRQRLTVLGANLGTVLGAVRHQAPGAEVVVTNYYDPFLAVWFTSPALLPLLGQLHDALNATISAVTGAYGGQVADVSTAFHNDDSTPTAGGVPTNVAAICTYTWMCQKGDIHANDAGYALMATAVAAKLSIRLRPGRGRRGSQRRSRP